jgi:hypothetical protein
LSSALSTFAGDMHTTVASSGSTSGGATAISAVVEVALHIAQSALSLF